MKQLMLFAAILAFSAEGLDIGADNCSAIAPPAPFNPNETAAMRCCGMTENEFSYLRQFDISYQYDAQSNSYTSNGTVCSQDQEGELLDMLFSCRPPLRIA